MEIIEIKHVPSKGGSLRYTVQHNENHGESQSIDQMIELEKKSGIHSIKTFQDFAIYIDSIKTELLSLIKRLKSEGKIIAGYGASVGVTTMIYHFGLSGEILEFIVDDNERRQDLYSPGFHIPVFSPDKIYQKKADYVIILAWQYSEPIIKKHQKFLEEGGHFIIPLPKLKVL